MGKYKAAIDCFRKLKNKYNCNFIQLDLKDSHPSITEYIVDKTISLGQEQIIANKVKIIKHCQNHYYSTTTTLS